MESIKIDSNLLRNKIQNLKVEKKRIDDILEKFKNKASVMDSFWTGQTGDKVKEDLVAYSNGFDNISAQLENYISFLENVAKNYEDVDDLIIKKMESNKNN